MSAIFFGGVPGRILDAWKQEVVTIAVSVDILAEYRRVGAELARRYAGLEITPLIALLASTGEVVEPTALEEPVSADPDDDKFLACARTAEASIIVSGDDDLLSISEWSGIQILSPRAFVDAHLPRQDS